MFSDTQSDYLRDYLDGWRKKHRIPSDLFVPSFPDGEKMEPRSLHQEVTDAIGRYTYRSSITRPDMRRHAVELWKLSQGVLSNRTDVSQLRARWIALPEAAKAQFREICDLRRQYFRRSGIEISARTLDETVAKADAKLVALVVEACCSIGESGTPRRKSRSVGKRKRMPWPSPVLTVPSPTGGSPGDPEKSALVEDLALIFHELTSKIPTESEAFSDLVRDVFDLAELSGADARLREFSDRQFSIREKS